MATRRARKSFGPGQEVQIRDTPLPVPPAPPKYISFEDALLHDDMVEADLYYRVNQYTIAWLDAHILGLSEVAGHYDFTKAYNPWNNNPATSMYATNLVAAYKVYRARVAG